MDAGWHPDPSGKFDQRYWDGQKWTDHVARGGEMMRDIAATVPPPPALPPRPPLKHGWRDWPWTGIVAGVVVLAAIIGIVAAFSGTDEDKTITATAQSTTEQRPVVSAAASAPATTSTATTVAPTTRVTTAPTTAALTAGQKNAIGTAQSYLRFSGFSRQGLINQLLFEKYSVEDATFAVDHIGANWNEEAAETARAYLRTSSFSRQGLIDQLIFEKYTRAEAEYGVSAAGL